jgi:hypothetical protein
MATDVALVTLFTAIISGLQMPLRKKVEVIVVFAVRLLYVHPECPRS